jgi:hypothetical protein
VSKELYTVIYYYYSGNGNIRCVEDIYDKGVVVLSAVEIVCKEDWTTYYLSYKSLEDTGCTGNALKNSKILSSLAPQRPAA